MKRWFITPFVAALAATFVFAALMLAQPGVPLLAPLGLLVAAAAPLAFFGWLFATGPARTDHHPILVSSMGGLGAVLSAGAVYRYGEAWNSYLAGGIAVLVGWMVYVRWYSVQQEAPKAPQPGRPLPAFSLETTDGERIDSTSLHGRPAVLVFYRGSWCPLCTGQITELVTAWRKLKREATLWFISNQDPRHANRLAQRFDLPGAFLHDPDGQATEALGLLAPGATPAGLEWMGFPVDAAVPTVIVVDADGIVRFTEVARNYRLRPDPEEYLNYLASERRAEPASHSSSR